MPGKSATMFGHYPLPRAACLEQIPIAGRMKTSADPQGCRNRYRWNGPVVNVACRDHRCA